MMGDLHVFGHSCCDEHFRLREENARLRQRVEELERQLDTTVEEGVAPLIESLRTRAEAAEAKLAEAQAKVRRLTAEGMAFSAEVERLRDHLLKASEVNGTQIRSLKAEVERLRRGLMIQRGMSVPLSAEAIDELLAPEVKPGSACADRAETVEQTHARWSARPEEVK